MPEKLKPKRNYPLEHVVDIGIDDLRIVLKKEHFDAVRQENMVAQFSKLVERLNAKPKSAKGKAFTNRLAVTVAGEFVLIECQPGRVDNPYAFACDFNPNRFLKKKGAVEKLLSFFKFLFGHDASALLSQALISRLDVNVDFSINILEGTLVHVKGKRGGSNVMRNIDGDGVLGSLYIGVPDSNRQVVVYDKAAKILKDNLAPHAGKMLAALTSPGKWNLVVKKLENEVPKPLWRMEVRCRPKPALPVAQLLQLADCFDDVKLMHLPPDRAPFNSSLGRTFIGLAAYEGIPAALQRLDERTDRRKFKRAVDSLPQVEWWNAGLLRDCIQRELDLLAPLFRAPEIKLPEIKPTAQPVPPARAIFSRTGPAAKAAQPTRSADIG
ncbi:hypothetical protein N5B55_05930 [Ralstonia pickettii]|uniref:hypothetical protein n=1 Tax=Ralstonia pickettii TaxID=329 RepID=UPI002714EC0B|nr:hypothetical protein [Ralstonia pickettii]WKZ86486.1 hypothetical protein N5B55_05930 [Ralstonia pickettii]